jgi:hypothetical protein
MQTVVVGAQIDSGDLFAIARPLPAAGPARAKTARLVQPVHID